MGNNQFPKPKVLRFATIREKVEEFRKEFIEDSDEIPVNIEDLIERKLEIEIRPEFGLLDQAKMEAFLSNDRKTLFIDSNRYFSEVHEKRTRFTLAHEVGHYALHGYVYDVIKFTDLNDWSEFCKEIDENDLDWFEAQANEFAGRLLVPFEKLLKEIQGRKDQISTLILRLYENDRDNSYDEESVEEYIKAALGRVLSDKFMVSSPVIENRIKKEKIFEELNLNFSNPSE